MKNVYSFLFFMFMFVQSTSLFAQPDLTVWHVSPDHLENHNQGVSNLWACGYEYYFYYEGPESSREFILVLRNEGDEALNLTLPLSLGGANSSDFSIVEQPTNSTLQPNERTHLVVRYTAPETYNDGGASLAIMSNDPDAANCSINFDVGSEPSTPTIEVLCDGEVIFPSVSRELLVEGFNHGVDLGTVMVGDCSEGPVTKTFTIRNNESVPGSVVAGPFCGVLRLLVPTGSGATATTDFDGSNPSDIVSISGPGADCFSVTMQPSGTVSAGGTVDFVVQFDPSSAGLKQATLCFDVQFGRDFGSGISIDIQGTAEDCPIGFASNNDLMFQDPCACDDPRNCASGGMTLFHDTLTVTGGPGLTLTAVAGATDFFSAVECFGGANTVISAGTVIPEVPAGSGTYKLEFWRPSGATPTLSVNDGVTDHVVPTATFEPVCTDAACTPVAPIPTMSEWGLMIFGLLVLNLGVFFVRKQEFVL